MSTPALLLPVAAPTLECSVEQSCKDGITVAPPRSQLPARTSEVLLRSTLSSSAREISLAAHDSSRNSVAMRRSQDCPPELSG